MFFFSSSATRRARDQALNLLQHAARVDAYRRDVVPAAQLGTMREASARLNVLLDDKQTPAEALNAAVEHLHDTMLPIGGDIYPLKFAAEYAEMILVAAIVVIGIRTFFLQPFKIPTNSMYPTYNGMTPYVYALDQPPPSVLNKAWNFLQLGAVHYELRAPADGEVVLPLLPDAASGQPTYSSPSPKPIAERTWSRLWLFTTDQRVCRFYVGTAPVELHVPLDFEYGFEFAFIAEYFPDEYAAAHKDPGRLMQLLGEHDYIQPDGHGGYVLRTGHIAHAGDLVLDFDLRTGDMLFVDRFSYNFISPKPGDPIVFHTGDIALLVDPSTGQPQPDQYYIKRLVGLPGDVLEVRPPQLLRNGAPITGSVAFAKNAAQEGEYPGYTNGNPGADYTHSKYLWRGVPYTVPPGGYFGMGDNSPTSYDSRYWGTIPARSLVGRAVFIIYPFSERWGMAK